MRGGGGDTRSTEELEIACKKHSMVYNILSAYNFYIYYGIVGILLSVSIYYLYLQVQIQGIPSAVDPVIGWDNEVATFLKQFFLLDRQSKGINAPGSTSVKPSDIENFSDKTITFASKVRAGIDVFCNIVSPCNVCDCTGPDPDYGGDQKDAPIIPYNGTKCMVPKTIETFIEGADGTSTVVSKPNPADNIIQNAQKLGLEHRIKSGEIPNCCCHLFNKLGVKLGDGTTDITMAIADTLTNQGKDDVPPATNALETILSKSSLTPKPALLNTTYPIGIPKEVGCEPDQLPQSLKGSDGKSTTPNNGLYAFAMIQACLSTKPISYGAKPIKAGDIVDTPTTPPDLTLPNKGKTPYDVNKEACSSGNGSVVVNLDNDRGYSKNSLYRSNKFFNALKSIILNASKGTPSSSFKVKDYIGKLPTVDDSFYPWVNNDKTPGPAWPNTHPAFMGDEVKTEWFYIVGDTKYELKIDNYLKEIYAFPINIKTNKTLKKNSNCTKDIEKDAAAIAVPAGVTAAVAFLKLGLVPKYKVLKENRSHIYHGAYIFP